jgi:hypothetical protein
MSRPSSIRRNPTGTAAALWLAAVLAACVPAAPEAAAPPVTVLPHGSGQAVGGASGSDSATPASGGMRLGEAAALPGGVAVNSSAGLDQLIGSMGGPMCKDEGAALGAKAPLPVGVATPAAGEPRLWVVELGEGLSDVVDVGTLPRDQASDHEFTLRNDGTATLEIENLSASCGCTRVEADSRSLAPGQTTTLHVTYDPTVAEDKGPTIQKKIRAKSNDPQREYVEFTMTGRFAAP